MKGLAAWLPSPDGPCPTFVAVDRTRTWPNGTIEHWSEELEKASRENYARVLEQLYVESEEAMSPPKPLPLRWRVRAWLMARTVHVRRAIVSALDGRLYEDWDE